MTAFLEGTIKPGFCSNAEIRFFYFMMKGENNAQADKL
jgi:hypothetical protein